MGEIIISFDNGPSPHEMTSMHYDEEHHGERRFASAFGSRILTFKNYITYSILGI